MKKLPYVMIGKLVWQALCIGQICLWATYSAQQLQSAVHYVHKMIFSQTAPTLKYCESVYMPKTYFLVNVQLQNVVTFSSIPEVKASVEV